MKSGIYKIANKANGKFYIGSSVNISNRWYVHKYELMKGIHHNPYLQNAWDKYGEENFVFSILIETKKELLLEKEQGLLDLTKCYNRNIGYNIGKIAGAAFLGRKHTKETRKKISASKLGKPRSKETRKKISEAQKGKTIPMEVREKISKTLKGRPSPMKGRKATEETKRKMSKSLKGIEKSTEWKKRIGDAQRGSRNHASKLTEEKVIAIKIELSNKDNKRSQTAIAKEYGVSPTIISQIKTGARWAHIEIKTEENNA
jgi:group I intron endonuclease